MVNRIILLNAFNPIYQRFIRPLLPDKIIVYGGVPVRQGKLFDMADEVSDYKKYNLKALKKEVQPNDRVIIIGGGLGVTSAVASLKAKPEGRVEIYEASSKKVKIISETLSLNTVEDVCRLNHAIVGELNESLSNIGNPDIVNPEELPDADVIELDCEGSEVSILKNIDIKPRIIVVETHPDKNSPTHLVTSILKEQGYEILTRHPDESDGDILTATLSRP